MFKDLYNKIEEYAETNNVTITELIEKNKLEEEQKKFINTNLGKAVNTGVNIGLRAILPNCLEDEIIAIKDSLITDGFSAALNTAIEETTNLGKSLVGIFTGNFENISQIQETVKKGGLIDTISGLLDKGINLAKKQGFISQGIASAIKKGKNAILDSIETNIDNTLTEQIKSIEKIDGYIEKWKQYYNEKNFANMEYQYNKIKKYLSNVIPLENTLNKAQTVKNLHELIKNNGKNFQLTDEQVELAKMLI